MIRCVQFQGGVIKENSPIDEDSIIDVAIVGAGCAGLYSAWRLSTQIEKQKVYVFEASDRVGGRLLSIDLLPEDGLKAELGGMRFTNDHRLVNNLISRLRGNTDVSPLDTRPFDFETKLMFLRGKHLRFDQDWRSQLRYDLPDLDPKCPLSLAALDMAKKAIQRSVALAKMNAGYSNHVETLHSNLTKRCLRTSEWSELQAHAKVEDINLYNLGFWNLLQHCLAHAPDEFLFLHDALGYESLVANSNAAQIIPVFLADFDVQGYHTLKGGMEALPRLLAFRCRQENQNCTIADHHSVETITLLRHGDNHTFELRVRCTPSILNKEISYVGTYLAKAVILAVPKGPLEKIELIGFTHEEEASFRGCLKHVQAHPAFKMFLKYEEPWWKDELGLQARAVTDLPIRQVYYMGEGERPNGPALVMASYSDEHYTDFWEPLVNDLDRMIEANAMRENAISQRRDISAYAASKRVIKKAESQLSLMHPELSIPSSQYGVVKEWKDAWHFWNVHTKPWETAERLIRPFAETNLFICGEAYSLEQGWVEGALKSAERVIQELKIPPHLADENFAEYISH